MQMLATHLMAFGVIFGVKYEQLGSAESLDESVSDMLLQPEQ